MNERNGQPGNPLDELLAERALSGLSAAEGWQLAHLLEAEERGPEIVVSEFDEIVARIDIELAAAEMAELPAGLAEKILAAAPEHVGRSRRSGRSGGQNAAPRSELPARLRARSESRAWGAAPWSGWLVAAAALLVALLGWWPRLGPQPAPAETSAPFVESARVREVGPVEAAESAPAREATPSPAQRAEQRPDPPPIESVDLPVSGSLGVVELRERLLADADDAQVIDWTPTGDLVALSASGDVAWSRTRQEGYMRFRGLPTNNPGSYQYQLWIFDAERDERFPVDGGVFDIETHGEDVIVPIAARLPVERATLFAVTLEEPGGVVVSSRERLVLLASAN